MTRARPVCGVVLAAGASKRLGQPKQLVTWRGEPLVRATARILLDTRSIDRVAVVTGAARVEVEAALDGLPTEVVVNADWPEGVGSSVRAAARWAKRAGAAALLIAVVDQLRLSTAHVASLVAAWQADRRTAGSGYGGTVGVPAIFDARELDVLGELQGDRGAARILRGIGDAGIVAWSDGAIDLDTPEDLLRHTEDRDSVRRVRDP